MKKVVLSMVMCVALLASSAVMAQNGKTETASKTKTEVKSVKTETKPAKTEKKSSATTKTEEPKKAACASSKTK